MVQNEGGDQWDVIELPMELPSGKPMWPEFWSKDAIEQLKATLDTRYWQAQYQQNPISEEGALIKREWWKIWEDELPPKCEYIITSVDTAHEKNNRADYSAFTTWGVFNKDDDEKTGKSLPNIILLDAYKKRMEFPELKKFSFEYWKEWNPDAFIVEKKSAGAPLYQELRAVGIPVQEYTPSKGQDKIARVNAVSDIIRSGCVWVPEKKWATELIDECAEFPAGSHDDYVDSTTAALLRYRQGGFIRLPSDEPEDEMYKYLRNRKANYY
jgi:predicted phage terminase large subunit-like protein